MAGFNETQSYGWGFDIIVAIVVLSCVILLWYNLDKRIRTLVFIFMIPFLLLVTYFMSEKLETRIDDSGIHYHMFPAQLVEKKVSWENISSIYIRDYILYSGKTSKYDVYSIDDKYGLYIILKDNTKIIIGTRKPDQINKLLQEVANNRAGY